MLIFRLWRRKRLREVKLFNLWFVNLIIGKPNIEYEQIRIGIHTGPTTAGVIGSKVHQEGPGLAWVHEGGTGWVQGTQGGTRVHHGGTRIGPGYTRGEQGGSRVH